ncbi:MAG: hypothetical protein AABY32_01240 [Nanoarchaeota archaeon]
MKMSECNKVFYYKNFKTYLPEGDYIIIVAGRLYKGKDFTHANIAAKRYVVHEFKHYMRNYKKWTAKPGVNYYFAIRKSDIEMLEGDAYSYVPVLIGGVKVILNVGGGSGFEKDIWENWVRDVAEISVNHPIKDINKIADIAISPSKFKELGIPDITFKTDKESLEYREREINHFNELVAKELISSKLVGMKVYTHNWATWLRPEGSTNIEYFDRVERPKNKRILKGYLNDYPHVYHILKYDYIDWIKTCEMNGVKFNKLAMEVTV